MEEKGGEGRREIKIEREEGGGGGGGGREKGEGVDYLSSYSM